MAYDEFFGYLFTSFGIPIVLILFTIITHPLRIITLIISASFWLISFLLSSIIWFAVVPIRDKLAFGLVISVLFQDLARILFIFCLHKIDRGIKLILTDLANGSSSIDRSLASNNDLGTPFNEIGDHKVVNDTMPDGNRPLIMTNRIDDEIFNVTTFAYVGGLGFGVISGLFASLNMLVALNGPGTLGYYGQSEDFIDLYAAQTLLVILLHTAFHVIVSIGWQSRSFVKIGAVTVFHMLFSCLTLANNSASPASEIIIGINCIICIVVCVWAFIEAGGQIRRLLWAMGLNCRRFTRFWHHQVVTGSINDSIAT